MDTFNKFLFGPSEDEKLAKVVNEHIERLMKGEEISLELGRNLEPVFVKIEDIPPYANRLLRVSRQPPGMQRNIMLWGIGKFMYDEYVAWNKCVEVTALTYKWGKLILLAHTTKVLEDEGAHHRALDSMLVKGEQCKYHKDLMFHQEDWYLLRRTVPTRAAYHEPIRKVITKLLKRSKGLKELLNISAVQLEEMGIAWSDTCDETVDDTGDEPAVTQENCIVTALNAGSNDESETKSPSARDGVQNDDRWEIFSITSVHSDDESVVWERDSADEEDALVADSAADTSTELSGSGHVTANNQRLEDGVEASYTPAQPTNDLKHPVDILAEHVKLLAVEEGAVLVNEGEQHAVSQGKDSDGEKEGVTVHQDLVVRHQDASPIGAAKDLSTFPGPKCSQNNKDKSAVVYTEHEMNAALAKLPALKSSKWASTRKKNLPAVLDAKTKATLTEFVNSHEETPKNGNYVTSEASAKTEQAFAFVPKKELLPFPSDSRLPVKTFQTVPVACVGNSTTDYFAGFVAMHDLQRSAPGSPAKVEAGGKKGNPISEDKIKVAASGSGSMGRKRKSLNPHDQDDFYTKFARRRHNNNYAHSPLGHEVPRWSPGFKYSNSALHALRAKQAAYSGATTNTSGPASEAMVSIKREEPTRQPKGPPTSGKEMADDKAKSSEAWPENFSFGAPPHAKNRSPKRFTFSYEKGVHSVGSDD